MRYFFSLLIIFIFFSSSARHKAGFTFDNIYKVYGNSKFDLKKSIHPADSAAGIIFSDELDENDCIDLSGINNAEVTIKKAGAVSIIATKGTSVVTADLIISKKYLRVTTRDTSRLYGDNNPTFNRSFNPADFVNGDNLSDIAIKPWATTNATKMSDVGTYTIEIVGGSDDNYFFLTEDAELEIKKRDLHVKPEDGSKKYGEPVPEIGLDFYEGFVNGDNEEDIDTLPKVSPPVFTSNSPVRIYQTSLSGGLDNNYYLNLSSGEFEITKALLKITILPKERFYGDPNPQIDTTVEGLTAGDVLPDLFSNMPECEHTASLRSPAGKYLIKFVEKPNDILHDYDVKFVEDSLTIKKAPLHFSIHDLNVIAGQEHPALKFEWFDTCFKNGESISDLDFDTSLYTPNYTIDSPADKYNIEFTAGVNDSRYQVDDSVGCLFVHDSVLKEAIEIHSSCLGVSFDMKINEPGEPASCEWLIKPPNGDYSYYFDDTLNISGELTETLHFDNITSDIGQFYFKCNLSYYRDEYIKEPLSTIDISTDSISIITKRTPPFSHIKLKGSHMLICTDNLIDSCNVLIDSITSYQWGFNTDTLLNDTEQYLYDPDLKVSELEKYWVITGYSNTCKTRSHCGMAGVDQNQTLTDEIEIIIPNPNNGEFNLRVNNLTPSQTVFIIIYDVYGGRIYYNTYKTNSEYISRLIRLNNVKPGFYWLTVYQNNQKAVKAFTVVE